MKTVFIKIILLFSLFCGVALAGEEAPKGKIHRGEKIARWMEEKGIK